MTTFDANGVFVAHIEIADAGTQTMQHAHAYPHLTILAKGSVQVSCEGETPRDFTAPAGMTIPADVKHRFRTLTDDVLLLCVHNTSRTGQVEIAEEAHIQDLA